jgi:hypothetical protein
MNIFKRNPDRNQGQKGGSFAKRLGFGRNRGQEQREDVSAACIGGTNSNSRNGPVDTSVDPDIDPAEHAALAAPTLNTNQGGSAVGQTLWDRAYDSLREENQQLVENYEKLLSKELLELSTPYLLQWYNPEVL